MNKNRHESIKYQSGAATLIFSIIILLLVTFVTLYTAKSINTETKVTNNDVRSRLALEAAEAGIAHAFEAFKNGKRYWDSTGVFGTSDAPSNILDITIYEEPGNSSSREVGFSKVTVQAIYLNIDDAIKNEDFRHTVTSVGLSDDKISSRTVVVITRNIESIENAPDNPFIARGSVSVSGSANIYNQEGASTVWSGGAVNAGGGETFIANPNDPNYPQCLESSFTCTTVQASDSGVGVDVVSNDSTLAGLSDDDFFANFFGMSLNDFRAQKVSTANVFDDDPSSSPDANVYDLTDKYTSPIFGTDGPIWIDGDLKTTGLTLGCSVNVPPNASEYNDGSNLCEASGGDVKPVTLVIRGDWTATGNTHIFGVVMVLGDLKKGAGTLDITGAIIMGGEASDTGNVNIWYNSDVIKGGGGEMPLRPSSSGWRDY